MVDDTSRSSKEDPGKKLRWITTCLTIIPNN